MSPPVAGRLSGELQGFPLIDHIAADPVASASEKAALPLRGLARVESLAAEASPDALHSLGLLRLAQGRFDTAVLSLQAAAARSLGNGEVESDLAAALLTRAEKENRPLDLVLAFEAADRSLAKGPVTSRALFNRAEALTRLHLRMRATEAWEAYLALEQYPAWRLEAAARLRVLEEPTLMERWSEESPDLETAAARRDEEAVQEIVSRFPHPARLWVEEEVLREWAVAHGRNQEVRAARLLSIAKAVSEALALVTGDALTRDSVAVILRATPESRNRLAAAHRAFGDGFSLYSNQQFIEARPLLEQAQRGLEAAGSPFRGWAVFYMAVCDHYSNPDSAFRSYRRLRVSVPADRYPVLAGRTEWLMATIEVNRGRPEEGLQRYRSAFALLDASSGPQISAFVRMLQAEAYTSLGEIGTAWSERMAALAVIQRSGEPRRVHNVLYEAAEALLTQGHPAVALEYTDELERNAREWGNPTALTEAGLQKGRALDLLGRADEAVEVFRATQNSLSKMAVGPQRDRVDSTLALVQAEELVERDPRTAVEILSKALSTTMDNGYLFQITRMLTARARAFEALGDPGRAEEDYLRAIEEHERVRGGVREEQFRLSSFERAQAAFDEMIRLQVETHGDAARAFGFAERSRSRLLLELVRQPALSPEDVVAKLPLGVALIEYALLPDRLLVWVVRKGSLELVSIRRPAQTLSREIDLLRNALARRGSDREIREAAAGLYDVLIRPLQPKLRREDLLVFVPDRTLVRIPFAMLFDQERERYLVEDHTIALAPSATLYLAAVARRQVLGEQSLASALVVGDPAFDRARHFRLPRLREAKKEAEEVAQLYPGAELLTGEAATRRAFLEAAPRHSLIHFAGHALIHPVSPRSSMLLFAPEGKEDSGALQAHDLVGQHFAQTEIVVLSACRTLEEEAGSRENLTGLAAAFLAAGPPVVLSGLWEAEDRATRSLMLAFHRSLRQGIDSASALREAQLQTLHGSPPDTRSPFFWAGFEVIGGVTKSPSNP